MRLILKVYQSNQVHHLLLIKKRLALSKSNIAFLSFLLIIHYRTILNNFFQFIFTLSAYKALKNVFSLFLFEK